MSGFQEVMAFLGYLLRALGSLVFGVAVGWLTLKAFEWKDGAWQLALAAFLGLLGTFVLLGRWVAGGAALGSFGLGAGAALLIWGLAIKRKEDEED